MAEGASLRGVLKRKPVVGWALYDWANSAFATTVMAGFFPVFYSAISQDISAEDSQFYFNITLAAASILIAVSAPILGAVSDRGGSRKKFLVFFASLGILMTAGLAWVHAGHWWSWQTTGLRRFHRLLTPSAEWSPRESRDRHRSVHRASGPSSWKASGP